MYLRICNLGFSLDWIKLNTQLLIDFTLYKCIVNFIFSVLLTSITKLAKNYYNYFKDVFSISILHSYVPDP